MKYEALAKVNMLRAHDVDHVMAAEVKPPSPPDWLPSDKELQVRLRIRPAFAAHSPAARCILRSRSVRPLFVRAVSGRAVACAECADDADCADCAGCADRAQEHLPHRPLSFLVVLGSEQVLRILGKERRVRQKPQLHALQVPEELQQVLLQRRNPRRLAFWNLL